jgi:hypothetical protein
MNRDTESEDDEALPGLTVAAVEQFGGKWNDGALWDDVLFLSDRVWSASEDQIRRICWHHFVLAVGNFKRQGGRRLRPASLHRLDEQLHTVRAEELFVPGLDGMERISMTDPQSWRALSGMLAGAGVATTTTILAALWPGQHIIFDWRVHAAVNAIRIHAGLACTTDVQSDSTYSPPITFSDYELSRGWILAEAARLGVQPNLMERTLYRLTQRAGTDTTETWQSYANRIYQLLTNPRPN